MTTDADYMWHHALRYALDEVDDDTAQTYADWYVENFGDDIMTAPSHRIAYWAWLLEQEDAQ